MIFPRVDAVLTPGQDGRAFARHYGASDDRILTVPQVIDVDHFRRGSDLSLTERDRLRVELGLTGVTFLYVGRLWLGKGLLFLLDAFRNLEKTNIDTTLLLVGDGTDEEQLRRRCLEIGARKVIFAGFHHADSLPQLYAASDVFVFPTLGDPFGLVVLEAMACGLPIIATNASGEIRDRVADGLNGFIVPAGDSGRLFDRMRILARDRALRERMGRLSANKAVGQTPDFWAQEFERAIASILASSPAGESGARGFSPPRGANPE
jgi:glycosyltransferase involved in cell wall biosynthesis